MGFVRRLGFGLILVLGAARVIFFLAYVVSRYWLPFEAFHLESKMVLLADRVRAGALLYPSWQEYPHVANFFGPLYFVLVGLMGRAAGADIEGLFAIGRALTLASALATSLGLGWYLRRRYGRGEALAGFLLSLGGGPMFGFAVMVRPDLLAEFFGVVGFYLSGRNERGWRVLGGALLVAAILTKQTAAVFLVASALAWFLEGERRRGLALLGGGLATVAAIVAATTLLLEPNFARDLLGESKTPWSPPNWLATLRRLVVLSPDMLVFPVVGLVLWNARRPRDVRSTTLTVVILAASLVTSAKRGADLNYYMSLRVVEALGVGALWHAARTATSRGGRLASATVAVLGGLTLLQGGLHALTQAAFTWNAASSTDTSAGKGFIAAYRRIFRVAGDPGVQLLTDAGIFDLYQRERAAFGDPWLFRMLVETGRIRPEVMRRKIEAEEYDLVITTSDVNAPGYATYEFGLPMVLAERVREHYALVGTEARLFVYQRRGAGPPGARRASPGPFP